MKTKRWTTSNKTVFNIAYHLIWCSKYRRSVLVGKIAKDFEVLVKKKAKELDVVIDTMEVMPEHVHLFVRASPVDSPHFLVQQLKGFTSHELRTKHASLVSRLPSLWTRSYYCESVGHISEEAIKRYIEDQKKR